MLKFSVQTFYQPLFSHSFPFSNFPLAILFSSVIPFPSKSFHTKKPKAQSGKTQAKAQSKSQRQKAKAPNPPSEAFDEQPEAGWSSSSTL
jgi:hypothetical protein